MGKRVVPGSHTKTATLRIITDWLSSQVYIVTGSNTGVGKELARMLYSKNAKVYIAARSEDKANKAIEEIKKSTPASTGALVFLRLDLSDLTTIKASAESFLSSERKLHVLFNNAGVMTPSQGVSKTAQGYELHLGVNNIGTFMFTKLLTPTLVTTAKSEPPNTVRVVWVSSSATEFFAHKSLGVLLDNLDYHIDKSPHYKADGVISIPLNPGNLSSELYRKQGAMFRLMVKLIAYPPVFGAYTELFAGLSPKVTIDNCPLRPNLADSKDFVDATKTEAEGGTGAGLKFWEWTEDQIRGYL
ncbi:hypothetical protein VTN96DRAFT_5845 [Rasamsonia emersonii]